MLLSILMVFGKFWWFWWRFFLLKPSNLIKLLFLNHKIETEREHNLTQIEQIKQI